MDYEQLKKHIARNLSRDEADPLKTYIPERTREDDIGAWLALAATANDEEDKALALASLIAEQSKMKPEDALLTWETNKELILRNRRARAVAYWGLARGL